MPLCSNLQVSNSDGPIYFITTITKVAVEVDLATWELPPVFKWLQQQSNLPREEMVKTFNCGVGMVLVVDPAKVIHVEWRACVL